MGCDSKQTAQSTTFKESQGKEKKVLWMSEGRICGRRGSDRLLRRADSEDCPPSVTGGAYGGKDCHPGPVFQTALGRWAAVGLQAEMLHTGMEVSFR